MLSRTFSPHTYKSRFVPRPSLRSNRGYRSLALTYRAFSPIRLYMILNSIFGYCYGKKECFFLIYAIGECGETYAFLPNRI